ncbi:MAG: LysR family transcriptional regulator substrate-binding protein, partial [Phycisphaerae bacterium]|nr:LysR family transcriptional regulator substrate-binding protein [Phycisphaerae bacterium]
KHRLAGRKSVEPGALNGEKFVAFEKNIPTRRHIDRLLKKAKAKVDIVMEFDNVELLKRAVEVNSGLSILPRGNVQREMENGYLSCCPFSGELKWIRRVGILRHRGKTPSPAERMFLGLLRHKGK